MAGILKLNVTDGVFPEGNTILCIHCSWLETINYSLFVCMTYEHVSLQSFRLYCDVRVDINWITAISLLVVHVVSQKGCNIQDNRIYCSGPCLYGRPPGHCHGRPNDFPWVPVKYSNDDVVKTASTLYWYPLFWRSLNKWPAPCTAGSHVTLPRGSD